MASPSLNPESTLSAGWEAAPAQVKSSSSEGTSSVQSFDSTSTSATEPEETSDPKRAAQAGENSLSEDPFDSPASRALFDAIDQLHSCNVSKYIEEMRVPQSLTDIPFPVGSNLCTRFATRIVSRRTAPKTRNKIIISIESDDFTSDRFNYPKNDAAKDFRQEMQALNAAEFTEIIKEASEKYMEIRPGQGPGHKNFATEVLKIELSGPKRAYFSILDIPGFIGFSHNINKGELEGVQSLVVEYMKQPGNIVICVADATHDLSNQQVFEMVNTHVEETRRVCVFTKCDSCPAKDKGTIVDIARGTAEKEAQQLSHGWFVVRNKIMEDELDPNFNLQSTEKILFDNQPWCQISNNRRGSSMLKKYLGKLLCDKIQVEFPRIFAQLQSQLKQLEKKKDSLGPERPSTHQRHAYLLDIAQRYSMAAEQAVNLPWDRQEENTRVRPIIRETNDSFAECMRRSGHSHPFQDHEVEIDGAIGTLDFIVSQILAARNKPDVAEKEKLISPAKLRGQSKSTELFDKIKKEVEICSSTQLPGMVHPDVIQRLYRMQTSKWHEMAADHVKSIASAVLSRSEALLNAVCPASGSTTFLNRELFVIIENFHSETVERVLCELEMHCDADQEKPLQTNEPGFVRHLQLLRSVRMARVMAVADLLLCQVPERSPESFGLLLSEECHPSAIEHAINDIHDTLKVYYQFSLQSFIRYVINEVVENFIRDQSGPLRGLSSKYVAGLDDDDLNRLGREDDNVIEERTLLCSQINTLKSVEKVARTAMVTASKYS